MPPDAALNPIQVTVLAFIQGFTEFLPISSSAHLILPSVLLGWQDQGLTFDVAVHLGSLLAVVWYFRAQLLTLAMAWFGSLIHRSSDKESARLAWFLIVATIPAGLAGLLLDDLIESYARSALIIGSSSILFGLLLWWADRRNTMRADRSATLSELRWGSVLLIGIAQSLALIPGTSRSGITMTAALFCGLDRDSATRFSFLLAIPIIAASGLLRSIELARSNVDATDVLLLAYATAVSALVAYACIHYFLRFISQIGFLPFVAYRVVLGAVLLMFFW